MSPLDATSPLVPMAFRLADQAVIADIESEGCKVMQHGMTWWDIRPMLDPHEHTSTAIDMAGLALAYALGTGLIARHPEHEHLVRVAHRT